MISKEAKHFFNIEKEFDLFNVSLGGLKIWELIRYDTFQLSVSNNVTGRIDTKNENFTKEIVQFIRTLLFHNPFIQLNKKEVLLFRSSRKNKIENKWIDMYLIDVETKYPANSIGLYETNRKLVDNNEHVADLYIVEVLTKITTSIFTKFTSFFRWKNKKMGRLLITFEEAFPQLEMKRLIERKLLKFKIQCFLYGIIFFFRKPKKIYITNYVSKSALIYSAKSKGIKVVEVQHGFTSPNLVLYHFPSVVKNSLQLFSDEYQYLSKYLIYKVELPISDKYISKYSGHVLNDKIKKNHKFAKEKDAILFVSQDVLYKEFLEYVEKFCCKSLELRPNLKIYYKPHPSEYRLLDMIKIESLATNYNFFFIPQEEDVYRYLHLVHFTAGVFTTLLVESLQVGNKVFSIKIKGYEFFMNLIEDDIIPLVETPNELLSQISNSYNE